MKNYINRILPYFCFVLLSFTLLFSSFSNLSENAVFGKVIRLHVIAASDSREDQAVKLDVRDGILDMTKSLFSECKSVDEAKDIAEQNISALTSCANRVLEKTGSRDSARLIIGKEHYPKKTYGSLTFPEGEYLSVRVIIGEGKGKNWWCVLFPPLCTAGIEESPEILEGYGIDKKQIEALKNGSENGGGINLFGTNIKLKFLDYFR